MPRFNLLYTVELNDKNKTDCRLIIIYDITNEKYYYYGTRSRSIGFPLLSPDFYIEFSGSYPETKIVTFVSFLKHLNDFFTNKMMVEMHNIELYEDEYETLTFEKIFNKLSRHTELFAYDNSSETEGSILEKLDMLSTDIA